MSDKSGTSGCSDLLEGIEEVKPAFRTSKSDLEQCRIHGIVNWGGTHESIYNRCMLLAQQVKTCMGSSIKSCLLEGPCGSGKTSMAATIGIESDFPYVKIISADSMLGLSERSKCAQIVKVFEDAYESPLSMIILDDIERLLEYGAIGPRYSNIISQTLLVLLKKHPPKGKNMLVIGTTNEVEFLKSIRLCQAFTATYQVPTLKTDDAKRVLQELDVFSKQDVDNAAEALNNVTIKKLYIIIEMAVQGEWCEGAQGIYSGKEKINMTYFYRWLREISRSYV